MESGDSYRGKVFHPTRVDPSANEEGAHLGQRENDETARVGILTHPSDVYQTWFLIARLPVWVPNSILHALRGT
jgi:hypothetical protein